MAAVVALDGLAYLAHVSMHQVPSASRFHRAASRRYSAASAAEAFLRGYLRGAVFARVRKLASLFKRFLSPVEIDAALHALAGDGSIRLAGSGQGAEAVYEDRPGRDA